VALSGDTLVVGAPFEASNATGINGDQLDDSAFGSGAVYVFRWANGGWSQEAYIKASNTDEQDSFGSSVTLSGDTLVVGAPGENSNATGINGDQSDNSAAGSGAVYVFRRTDGGWSQEEYIKASNTDALDGFGASVALSGDTLVVGAHHEASNATGIDGDQSDNSSTKSGAVYVFTRTDEVWSQQAYLKASNTGAGDFFGSSVTLSSGDLSGITLAVGAIGEDSGATGVNGDQFDNSDGNSGAVYVFRRPSGIVTQTIPPSTISRDWKQQIYVKASNTSGHFGSDMALSNDTLVVGASAEDNFTGAVYVYHATK
jgi:trimeric autotransporter adhesin